MKHKNLILAAANQIDVILPNGEVRRLTIADSCHFGRNMQDIMDCLREAGCQIKHLNNEEDRGQGFIGESCQFYNRSEAWKVAYDSYQPLNPEYELGGGKLDSSCIRHLHVDRTVASYCSRDVRFEGKRPKGDY